MAARWRWGVQRCGHTQTHEGTNACNRWPPTTPGWMRYASMSRLPADARARSAWPPARCACGAPLDSPARAPPRAERRAGSGPRAPGAPPPRFVQMDAARRPEVRRHARYIHTHYGLLALPAELPGLGVATWLINDRPTELPWIHAGHKTILMRSTTEGREIRPEVGRGVVQHIWPESTWHRIWAHIGTRRRPAPQIMAPSHHTSTNCPDDCQPPSSVNPTPGRFGGRPLFSDCGPVFPTAHIRRF